ncbi:extracellular solute-binding protein [Candidatus Nitrosocosmicus hydrocola]|uniref:extracellular solute-binding protein n=1 Tax=Candidatus Nitrosocosmicus hydrocola TaxID=1826872 RepID=UPI0011E5CB4E|nr:extracellular solute-binding protein [Candidatus Nitrosocosmicus hydrocola]
MNINLLLLKIRKSMKRGNKVFIAILVTLVVGLYAVSLMVDNITANGTSTDNQKKVFVMYAGSLVKIFEDIMGPAFQNESGYFYEGEGKGSVQVANLIKDKFRTPDVFVSAGTVPIVMLMNTTPPLVDWLIKFGSAEIVIAYNSNSQYFEDLEKARKGEVPWYDVVSKSGFKFGRTDPELDPKGYYGIITGKLAGIYYDDSSIKERIIGTDRNSKQIFPEETLKTVLETGQLDAIIAYKHEAVSRGLPYITLPKEINLGYPIYSDYYKLANYTMQFDDRTIYGEPVEFSITIPKTVKNMEGATSFLEFILSKNGSQLLENQGLNPINLTSQGGADHIPSSIKEVLK